MAFILLPIFGAFKIKTLHRSVANRTVKTVDFSSTNECHKDGENVKFHFRHVMLYECLEGATVGTATKDIQSGYLNLDPAFREIKNWVDRFCQGDSNLHIQTRTDRPSDIDEQVLLAIIENKSNSSTEEIVKNLIIDISTASLHLKRLGS